MSVTLVEISRSSTMHPSSLRNDRHAGRNITLADDASIEIAPLAAIVVTVTLIVMVVTLIAFLALIAGAVQPAMSMPAEVLA